MHTVSCISIKAGSDDIHQDVLVIYVYVSFVATKYKIEVSPIEAEIYLIQNFL